MRIIDTHLHLWETNRLSYPWLAAVPTLDRPFLMPEYSQAMAGHTLEKLVFVQADCLPEQYHEEIIFAAEQATAHPSIQGIVAYLPLEKGLALQVELELLQQNKLIKGVRRMTENEPELCLTPDFLAAVRLLPRYNLSLEVCIKPFQTAQTLKLMQACPETLFVLDHLGKPDIKNGGLIAFQQNLSRFAAFPNVVAKVSGLLTEADPATWQPEHLKPYLYYAIDTFGFDRLLYGSDWPVVNLAGGLQHWLDALCLLLKGCTVDETDKLFYQNAARVYRLDA